MGHYLNFRFLLSYVRLVITKLSRYEAKVKKLYD